MRQGPAPEIAWTRAARGVARKVNFGWWLQILAGPLAFGSIAACAALLFARSQWPQVGPWQWGAGLGGLVTLCLLVAWLRARQHFESPAQALVRLEDSLGLHNALSTARAGIGGWPSLPSRPAPGLQWNWRRILPPLAAAPLFLAAGLLVPVTVVGDPATSPDEPAAWAKIGSDLDRLEEASMIDQDYIEETRKKLEELRSQAEENWFSHSSLEATDSLEEFHKAELQRLSRNAKRARQSLNALQAGEGHLASETQSQLRQQLDQALQGLQNGAIQPNAELLKQLQQLNLDDLGQLSEEQLQQLRENLEQLGQSGAGGQGGQENDWTEELLDGQDGEGEGAGEGEREGAGRGGVTRGPGEAGHVLGREGEKVDVGTAEKLTTEDLSRALPGDLLQIHDGEHPVDLAPSGRSAGGTLENRGAGGDRVWRESLDPAEQRALKRFFK